MLLQAHSSAMCGFNYFCNLKTIVGIIKRDIYTDTRLEKIGSFPPLAIWKSTNLSYVAVKPLAIW